MPPVANFTNTFFASMFSRGFATLGWFMTTILHLSLVRRVDGAADGQEEVGMCLPPHRQAQAGVCSGTPTTWSFSWYWQDVLPDGKLFFSPVLFRHS